MKNEVASLMNNEELMLRFAKQRDAILSYEQKRKTESIRTLSSFSLFYDAKSHTNLCSKFVGLR